MPTRTTIANGTDPVQQKAASDANAAQDGCNLIAIVGAFHRHLLALHRAGVFGDNLNNHPVALAFVSKLVSLCRMSDAREMAALNAIDRERRVSGNPVVADTNDGAVTPVFFSRRPLMAADILISDHGSVAVFTPTTPIAHQWVEENVHIEPWQGIGASVACEPRCWEQLVAGMKEDGLVVRPE